MQLIDLKVPFELTIRMLHLGILNSLSNYTLYPTILLDVLALEANTLLHTILEESKKTNLLAANFRTESFKTTIWADWCLWSLRTKQKLRNMGCKLWGFKSEDSAPAQVA